MWHIDGFWTAWIHLLKSSINTGQWGPVHTGQPEYTSLTVLNQCRTVRVCSHWTAWIHLLKSSINTGQWGSVHTGQPEYTSHSPQSVQDSQGLFTLDNLNTLPHLSPQSVQDSEGLFTLDSLNTPPSRSSISTGQWGPVHTGQPEYTSHSPQSIQDSEGLFTLDSLNTPPLSPQSIQDSEGLFTLDNLNTPSSVLNQYRTVRACSHWTTWIHLLKSSINTGQWGPVHTGQPEYTSRSPQSIQDSKGLFTLDSLNTPP